MKAGGLIGHHRIAWVNHKQMTFSNQSLKNMVNSNLLVGTFFLDDHIIYFDNYKLIFNMNVRKLSHRMPDGVLSKRSTAVSWQPWLSHF